jgi:hypothetical protein
MPARRTVRRALLVVAAAVLAALALAATAGASAIKLKCGGAGGHTQSTEGPVCAALPGKARSLEGVLRDDSNKPTAGKVSVTFANWILQGDDAFSITPEKTITVSANAAGKFTVPVKTTGKVTVTVEAVADEKQGVTASSAVAEVDLELQTTVKKLGGGRVKVTVKGTQEKLKIGITDETGYYVHGGTPKKAANGVASFDLGSAHGGFDVYIDAGALSDLFWPDKPSFRL